MKRTLLAAGLILCVSASSGCCHLWESIHYWEDCLCCECGPGVHGCNWGWGDYGSGHANCDGCGGCYYGEWHQDAGCDPCDCHGNWVGPGYATAAAPHGGPYVAEHQTPGEQSVIVAEQHEHEAPKQRLR